MELVHVDYVGIEVTISTQEKQVVWNVLVIVDHITRHVQAHVTKHSDSTNYSQSSLQRIVFRFLQQLMSDQGTTFTSKVIHQMCSLLRIEKIRTTPYHPQSNGSAKRVHQTLRWMIGKLDLEKHQNWLAHLRPVVITYNLTQSLVTGYSPHYLMFGWRPWLPIDLLFPTQQAHEQTCTIDEYVETLYKHFWESMKLAQDLALKEALRQKSLYERKVRAVELRPGDCVLVKLDAFRGQRLKLKNWWGDSLHTVVLHMMGKKKVLHQSRLVACWLRQAGTHEPHEYMYYYQSHTLSDKSSYNW